MSTKKEKTCIHITLQIVTDCQLICILLFFLGDIINQRNLIPGGRTGSQCQVLFTTIFQNYLILSPPLRGYLKLDYFILIYAI